MKSSAKIEDELLLTVEHVKEEDPLFIEKSKDTYERMRQLKRDVDMHEKKKRVLEQQIDKMRGAFQEYVQSLEALENSALCRRVAPTKTLNHSRLLKYCHVYMPPELPAGSKVDAALVATIKKAQAEYKQTRGLWEAVALLEKDRAIGLEGTAEIERRFEIYEKKVGYAVSKMNFAFLVNKLSLQLMKSIYNEVEDMQRLSTGHKKLCLNLEPIKRYQYRTSENRISQVVAEELGTVTQLFYEEIERQKRRLLEVYRPVSDGVSVQPPVPTITRRVIPRQTAFIVSAKRCPAEFSFMSKFQLGEKTLRGVFQVHKRIIVIQELVFGWELAIAKVDIFGRQFFPDRVRLEYQAASITIFCSRREAEQLSVWLVGVSLLDPHEVHLATLEGSVDNNFTLIFEENFANEHVIAKSSGYLVVEDTIEEQSIRKRQFLKRAKRRGLGLTVGYQETYLVETQTANEIVLLLYSEVAVPAASLTFSGISKIKLRQHPTADKTEIFYSFRKSTTRSVFSSLTKPVIQEALVTLHLLSVRQLNGEIHYTSGYGISEFFILGGLAGLLAMLAATGAFYQLFRAITAE